MLFLSATLSIAVSCSSESDWSPPGGGMVLAAKPRSTTEAADDTANATRQALQREEASPKDVESEGGHPVSNEQRARPSSEPLEFDTVGDVPDLNSAPLEDVALSLALRELSLDLRLRDERDADARAKLELEIEAVRAHRRRIVSSQISQE